jgi:hypothetical protein
VVRRQLPKEADGDHLAATAATTTIITTVTIII